MKKRLPVNIIVKPLGQYREKNRDIVGLYFSKKFKKIPANTILIDPRQNQRCFLSTLIHEMLHKLYPGWTETQVEKTANQLTTVIWSQGYRKEY